MVTPGPGVRPAEDRSRRYRSAPSHRLQSAGICIAVYGFLIPERARIPRRPPVPIRRSRRLAFPTVFGLEVPPIRPERHVINSMTTVRQRLTVALAKRLIRRGNSPTHRRKFIQFYDAVRLVARGFK